MKTLSIRQPWADLLVRGVKDVENRTWTTSYRGPVLIHAGASMQPGRMAARFYGPAHEWELGGIVGIADLVDVVQDSASPWAQPDLYHWVFANPRRVDFLPCKGKLQLYETPWPPSDEERAVGAPARRDERQPPNAYSWDEPALAYVVDFLSRERLDEVSRALGGGPLPDDEAEAFAEMIRRFGRRFESVISRLSLEELNGALNRLGSERARSHPAALRAVMRSVRLRYDDIYDEEYCGELVVEPGIEPEAGWIYFLDEEGNLKRGKSPGPDDDDLPPLEELTDVELVRAELFRREPGYVYEIGDAFEIRRFTQEQWAELHGVEDDDDDLEEDDEDDLEDEDVLEESADEVVSARDEACADEGDEDAIDADFGDAEEPRLIVDVTRDSNPDDSQGEADEEDEEDEDEDKTSSADIEVLAVTDITREDGYLYFIDKQGDVSRTRMTKRGAPEAPNAEKVAKVGLEREQGWLYYLDANCNVVRSRMSSQPRRAARSAEPTTSAKPTANTSLEDLDTDEVMAAFRQAAREVGVVERTELLRAVSRQLGFQRMGHRIEERLRGHLRAAIRRGIIEPQGDEVALSARRMDDYAVEHLRDVVCSVMRKGTRYDRDDVVRAVARYLGFQRVTSTMREPVKSAITSAIRQGLVAYEGREEIWRVG